MEGWRYFVQIAVPLRRFYLACIQRICIVLSDEASCDVVEGQ